MIEYIPDFKDLPEKYIVLEILWKKGATASKWTAKMSSELVETFPIYQEKIYLDLDNAVQKIQALKLGWKDDENNSPSKNLVLFVPQTLLRESKETIEHVITTLVSALYPKQEKRIILTHDGDYIERIENILELVNVVHKAREMAMIPANVGTPEYMVREIKTLFKKIKGCTTKIYTYHQLEKKKLGLITAVGKSASILNKPAMIVIERKPLFHSENHKRVCLIGKGVTFDTGGLSIKNYDNMYDMKYDKIGGVYIAHVLRCILKDSAFDKHHFISVLPFAENAVSDKAVHPGDIIRSYSGKTVEITDPDAEGRLLLADAFAWSEKYKPDILIDLATLTGHSDSINCWHKGYVFCEPEIWKPKIEKITNLIGERMLTMPSWTEYANVLKSEVADLNNSPIQCSDAFVAALFLREFLPSTVHKWVHIDLAHEFDSHYPQGNGIRTIHTLMHTFLKNKV